MDEYIDREAVKSAIYEIMDKYDPYDRCDSKAVTALQGADDAIDLIPAADVVPVGEVISVPPHGRLIDAEALIIALETQDYSCAPDTLEEWTPMDMTKAEIGDIRNAPTIIPAEEGET